MDRYCKGTKTGSGRHAQGRPHAQPQREMGACSSNLKATAAEWQCSGVCHNKRMGIKFVHRKGERGLCCHSPPPQIDYKATYMNVYLVATHAVCYVHQPMKEYALPLQDLTSGILDSPSIFALLPRSWQPLGSFWELFNGLLMRTVCETSRALIVSTVFSL